MSASREKKQRQGGGVDDKQRREIEVAQKKRSKVVRYSVIGGICAVLVIALLIWNSNFFQRRTVAATVGDKQYTVSDVAFYYNNAKQTVANYAQYGLASYDTSLSDAAQTIDESTAQNLSLYAGLSMEAGQTYATYFQNQTLDALKTETALCQAAQDTGYTLSEEGKQSVETTVASYKQGASNNGYTLSTYLRAIYGPNMTEKIFRERITASNLASEYFEKYQEGLIYGDEQLLAYYEENADNMDTYDFRAFYFNGSPAAKTDTDGNAIDATEAETATALGTAKTKAEAMLKQLQDGMAFNAAAKLYADDDTKDSYDDPDYNRQSKVGSSVNSLPYADFLTDAARVDGDSELVESSSGTGYYVVQFHGRALDKDTYYSADIRHILVLAETDAPVEAEDGTTTTPEPTEAQYAAAKAKLEEIQAEFEAGDKTPEAFAALAETNSEDPGSSAAGGYYQVTQATNFFADFKTWCLDPARQSGDFGIIQNTQKDQWGYHLIYFENWGPLVWKNTAQVSLANADSSTWLESLEEPLTAEAVEKGMAMITG